MTLELVTSEVPKKKKRVWVSTPEQRSRDVARYAANPEKQRAADAKWRATNPEKYAACRRAASTKYRKANPGKQAAYDAARRAANPEKLAGRGRAVKMRAVGVAVVEGAVFSPAPDQRCECCGGAETGSKYGWNLDHCHAAKKLRGWLCAHCNRGLGGFHDSPKKLLQAVNYLGRHGLPMTLEDFQTLIQPIHHNTDHYTQETHHAATQ